MAAVPFLCSENPEVLPQVPEDPRGGQPDRLDPIVVGCDAIDDVERVCAARTIQDRGCVPSPVGALLLHFAEGITAAFERLQGFVKGLRRLAVVDQAAPQVDDFVDIFNQQRAFRLAGAASRTGPDLIFREQASDQRLVVLRLAPNRVSPECIVPGLAGKCAWCQRPAHGIGRALVGAPAAVGARVEIQDMLPCKVVEFLDAELLYLVEFLVTYSPTYWFNGSAV